MGQIFGSWVQIQPTILPEERKKGILDILSTYQHRSCN